jgi:hypothetical protein
VKVRTANNSRTAHAATEYTAKSAWAFGQTECCLEAVAKYQHDHLSVVETIETSSFNLGETSIKTKAVELYFSICFDGGFEHVGHNAYHYRLAAGTSNDEHE